MRAGRPSTGRWAVHDPADRAGGVGPLACGAVTEPTFLRDTRAAYDAMAADYAERFRDEVADKPLDRAMFAAFAELVRAAGSGPVADVGCGPGHVTAHLRSLGLTPFGVDLSPGMVRQARRRYPELRFEEGSMLALDVPDGILGGVVANYSIIHIPPPRLPEVFAGFHRALAPGGHLLLSFQVGDEVRHRTEAFGHPMSLHAHRLRPDRVADLLESAGLVMSARLVREPADDGVEKSPQAFLLARRPVD